MINSTTRIKMINSEILDRLLITTTTDENGVIIDASKGFELISGYSKEELIGNTHHIMSHPDMPQETYKQLWKVISTGKAWSGEIKNRDKNGNGYWSQLHIEPISENNRILGYLAIRTDITEQKELVRQATTDSLTGIYNRSKFNLLLINEAAQANRNAYTFSFLFIDLDHFKRINDCYGHLEGDRVLVEFTKVISNTLRSSDLFGRWGGEEFVVITPKTDLYSAYLLAEKLRNCIQKYDFGLDQSITLSIGISQYDPNRSINELMEAADRAMYKAKEQGRNQTITSEHRENKD